jgi:hypothetical protein
VSHQPYLDLLARIKKSVVNIYALRATAAESRPSQVNPVAPPHSPVVVIAAVETAVRAANAQMRTVRIVALEESRPKES